MKQSELNFSCNLIKGKIAEVIFEQMIRNEKRYTVIPFGYEHTMPMLAQYRERLSEVGYILKNITDAPDFVLVSETKPEIYLVEIKFQSVLDIKKLLSFSNKLQERWLHAFLFVVTPDGFFCDYAGVIFKKKSISPLSENWVSKERQEAYLQLLGQFDKISL